MTHEQELSRKAAARYAVLSAVAEGKKHAGPSAPPRASVWQHLRSIIVKPA